MPILVRDAATEHHAVIGLAAISSPVVQIAERDQWMGWDTDTFLESIRETPTQKVAQLAVHAASRRNSHEIYRRGSTRRRHPPTD